MIRLLALFLGIGLSSLGFAINNPYGTLVPQKVQTFTPCPGVNGPCNVNYYPYGINPPPATPTNH